MSLINKTKKSFFGVLLSLVIAPFETFNIMINHENIRYSWSVLLLFALILLSPEFYMLQTSGKNLYLPGFLNSFALILTLTVIFYAILLRMLFFIVRLKSSTWRTLNGTFYILSSFIFFTICIYIYNYLIISDLSSLVIVPRPKILAIKNTKLYFQILSYLTFIFFLLQIFSLSRALGKLSAAGTFIMGFASMLPLFAAHVLAITLSKLVIPQAKDLYLQFLFSPFSVIFK